MDSFEHNEILWKDILNATNRCKYKETIGLRNRLFLDLKSSFSLNNTINYCLFVLRILFSRHVKFETPVGLKKVLFYFPFNTSSNYGNLYPVFKVALNKEINGLAIKTAKIATNDLGNCIIKEQLYKYANYSNRLISLFGAIRINHSLFQSFKGIQRNYSSKYAGNYLGFLYHIYLICLTEIVFSELIKKQSPIAVISTSDFFPIDYALFNTANKLNVPTYLLQHGIIGISHIPFTAKKIIVYGELNKEELIRKGVDSKRIILGGMPASDIVFNNKREVFKATSIRRILILSDTQGALLYPSVYSEYLKVLKALVCNNPEITFSIKLHPAENCNAYVENSFLAVPNFSILPKETSLSDSFSVADIALTIWSTAGIDAMLYGIPLIVMDVNEDVKKYAWWPEYNGGVYFSQLGLERKEHKFANLDFTNVLVNQEIFLKKYFSNRGYSAESINSIISNAEHQS